MIFYRLALQRFISYFELDKPSIEEQRLRVLLHKKPKEAYKTKLKTDKTLNLYISILLSLVGILICLSIPLAIVESPCDIIKEREMFFLYNAALIVEEYLDVLDYFIIVFIIMLIYVSVRTILDAIKKTKINISPWIERGKYTLPNSKKQVLSFTCERDNLRMRDFS